MSEVVALSRISAHGDVGFGSKSSSFGRSVHLRSNEIDVSGCRMFIASCAGVMSALFDVCS